MRRIVALAVLGGLLVALAVLGAVVFRTDEVSELPATGPADGPRGDDTSPERGGPSTTLLTTPPDGGPVESEGAAPVRGALLSRPVDDVATEPAEVTEETDCSVLDPDLVPLACSRVQGSGGHFLVLAGRHDDGALESRLYRSGSPDSTEFVPVARSEVFEFQVEVFDLRLAEARVGGEPVVIVDYDFDGSGSVHSFDVVAWDEGSDTPGVVAHVNGTGQDRFALDDPVLRFVGANYEDGAPTCCPNQVDVRTLERTEPGTFALRTETVPFSEAP